MPRLLPDGPIGQRMQRKEIDMHVIIFAGGTIQAGSAVQSALAEGALVFAVDIGAASALSLGYVPAWVGRVIDSLEPPTRTKVSHLGAHSPDALVAIPVPQ